MRTLMPVKQRPRYHCIIDSVTTLDLFYESSCILLPELVQIGSYFNFETRAHHLRVVPLIVILFLDVVRVFVHRLLVSTFQTNPSFLFRIRHLRRCRAHDQRPFSYSVRFFFFSCYLARLLT
jgi:hypothetical protein